MLAPVLSQLPLFTSSYAKTMPQEPQQSSILVASSMDNKRSRKLMTRMRKATGSTSLRHSLTKVIKTMIGPY